MVLCPHLSHSSILRFRARSEWRQSGLWPQHFEAALKVGCGPQAHRLMPFPVQQFYNYFCTYDPMDARSIDLWRRMQVAVGMRTKETNPQVTL
jgi:hypothetical protein